MLVVLGCVRVDLLSSLLAAAQASFGSVKVLTLGVDLRREQRRRLLLDPLELLRSLLVEEEALPIDAHIVELAIDKDDLSICQAECLAIDETFDHLQLLDHQGLAQTLSILDSVQEFSEDVII